MFRLGKKGKRTPKVPVGDVRDAESLYHFMLKYLSHLAEKHFSSATIEMRERWLRAFILWCDERGVTKPQQVDRPFLEQYQRHLFYHRKANGEPLTLSTQISRVVPIRDWFKWMVRQGKLPYNPAADLDLPKKEIRLPKAILSAKEAEAVLAVPDVTTLLGLRDRAILETFYSTGIRRMEMIGLHVHEVDFDSGVVMIRQGKGRRDRMIPIGERALAWIEKYRDTVRPGLVVGADDGTLFLTILGEPFTANRMSLLVKDYVNQAGIGKKGSCHLFRHTMATLMLEGGADIRFVQEMLGHASLDTVIVYTRVSIRKLKAVHTATHPGRMPRVGQHPVEEGSEPHPIAVLPGHDGEPRS